MDTYKLFDAEYRLLSIIWEHEPVNSTRLAKECQTLLGWKKPTTYTMLRKLSERGILVNRDTMVSSLIKKEQVQKYESELLMEKAFDNSLPAFVAAFLRDRKLSLREAEELKRMIEEASE
jgi:predicted transcriptional regulator